MKRLARIAEMVFNTPLLIESAKMDAILGALAPRFGLAAPAQAAPVDEKAEKRDIYSVGEDAIAVIDIQGALANRFGAVDAPSTYLLSYEELLAAISEAASDEKVRGVILRVESPGGAVNGLMTLTSAISRLAEKKPVWAAVDDYAYSAAYWIASATNRIYVTETGGVGSVGVIAKHLDVSEFNKAAGLKVTSVFAGARKNDFSSEAPLSDEAYARLKTHVDELYGMFVDAVAKNRRMAKSAVRATEADTYHGADAIGRGLADKMGSFQDARAAMAAMLSRGTRDDAPAVITGRKAEDRGSRREGIELRELPMSELRAAGSNEEPLITGHIAVFDAWSMDLGGFRERIVPGAFTKTIQEADIHHYWNHDSGYVLGRNKSGTLRLSEDAVGLHIENDPPNTQTIRDLVLEPIRRGDVDQGSFAFLPVRQEWGRIDGVLTRTLHEIRLFHTSIVPRGAYPQTDIDLRAATADLNQPTGAAVPLSVLSALSAISVKMRYRVPLSAEESEFKNRAIEALSSQFPVTPGKAHLTESAAKPPSMETLRMRLALARLAPIGL